VTANGEPRRAYSAHPFMSAAAGGAYLGARSPAAGTRHWAGCEAERAGERQDPLTATILLPHRAGKEHGGAVRRQDPDSRLSPFLDNLL
jgi:hypothetical protein